VVRAERKGLRANGTRLAAIGAVLSAVAFGASAQSLPNSPGKDTFESVCSLCHDASTAVMGKQWTRPQWETKVAEMLQEETDVTAEERAAILEYLAANFKPGGKIYINKATAKDLETLLGLAASNAEAVARYRTEHGLFKTFADLENAVKSVPTITAADAARIAAMKERLQFSD
jgi:competence ComEA-like helix-hairpin-helix protein